MKKTTYKSLLAALAALLLAACTQDELMQDNPSATGSRGSLHVTEVTLPEGGMQSRVATENGTSGVNKLYMPFNVAATGFDIDGDFVTVKYSFGGEAEYFGYLDYTSSEWSFNPDWDSDSEKWNPTRPNQDAANGESWANFSMQAYIQFDALFGESGSYTGGVGYVDDFSLNNGALLEYFTAPNGWDYDAENGQYTVNGKILDARMYLDKLVASTEEGGGITADTDLTSPTLGSFRVALKHAHAMLRLPQSAITTEPLIVEGEEVNPTFKTLWAELSYDTDNKMYIPLTEVTLSGNTEVYQAIVPVKEGEAAVTLTGFQMVYTDGEEVNTPYTHVFDLGDGAVALAANTRYPLTLTLGPRKTEVTLTAPTGKPGWSEDESELSNFLNEGFTEGVVYDTNTNTFTVSTANGLVSVNKWMTGQLTDTQYSELTRALSWPSGDEATRMKQNITLEADITLPTEGITLDEETGQPSGSNWTPVGNSTNKYTGTIDGGGHTITGLRISSTSNYTGLVGFLGDGTVKNLTLRDAVVYSKARITGGIAGVNDGGTVSGCTVSGSVTGGNFTGGIAGVNDGGTVSGCTVSGSVTGGSEIGGIVGGLYGSSSIVMACGNTATVAGSKVVGGIVGYIEPGSTVTGCWTSDTQEKDSSSNITEDDKDGIGKMDNLRNATACYSGDAATINGKVTDMNTAIGTSVTWNWQAGTGTN